MSARTWSPYQTAIFNFVETDSRSAIVCAVAGSGKSTTIVECNSRVKAKGLKALFLAFGKAIADELKSRGVDARTFHSIAYSVVTKHIGVRDVDQDKLRKLCREFIQDSKEFTWYASTASKLVGMARQMGVGTRLCADTAEVWWGIVDHHAMELEAEEANMERCVDIARKLLAVSNNRAKPNHPKKSVDFDDLLYIAVRDNLALAKYDVIFVDECQDTNAIQRELLRMMCHATTRVVAVGDPAQAIYGFRGADSTAMDMLRDQFSCIELPLTVSYRCPQAVARYAQQWVKHIEAAPGAQEGAVTTLTEWNWKSFQPNDLVVCRKVAPLVSLCFHLLQKGVPAALMGREIGEQMKTLIRKMNAGNDIDILLQRLEAWMEREVAKAEKADNETLAENTRDRYYTIEFLCTEALYENNRTVAALINRIDDLFADGVDKVKLCSIHKSKGLEAKRVFWLQTDAIRTKRDHQAQQEDNLCYVAATRAQEELILINEEGLKRDR